jgi:hypothetical protein
LLQDKRKELLADAAPGAKQDVSAMAKKMGDMWKAMSEEDKKVTPAR